MTPEQTQILADCEANPTAESLLRVVKLLEHGPKMLNEPEFSAWIMRNREIIHRLHPEVMKLRMAEDAEFRARRAADPEYKQCFNCGHYRMDHFGPHHVIVSDRGGCRYCACTRFTDGNSTNTSSD